MSEDIQKEHRNYIKKIKTEKRIVVFFRILILVAFIFSWEIMAKTKIINPFITSCPSKIVLTVISLIKDGSLFKHLFITLSETVIGFTSGTILGTIFAVILWLFPRFAKITDPYLVILNSLPKVALGPIIIVWAGAGISSILVMTLSISLITTIIGVYSGFTQTQEEKITLLKTFGATKKQILFKVILPSSTVNIINALKINVGLSWVGVIMGEFLVSKAGLGYMILYGSQVFNLDLVMSGIVVLSLVAGIMYFIVAFFEKKLCAHIDKP